MGSLDAVFLFLRALTWRGALSLLDVATHPSYTLSINFLAPVRFKRSLDLEEVVEAFTERVLTRLVRETLRFEREGLRPERKRAWSQTKTRCPVRHHVERLADKVSFGELVALAVEAARLTAERFGPPWIPRPEGRRGRPPNYDPTLQAAPLLVKYRAESCLGLGFGGLAKRLQEIGFDARLPGRGGPPTPSPETLYRAFRKTPGWWLDEAVAQLDWLAAEEYARRFGRDGLDLFSLDSTELRLQGLVVVERAFKRVVAHETLYVAAASRLLTNTIVAVAAGKGAMGDAKPFILRLPAGSTLVTDGEFDAEPNYEEAAGRHVKLVCKVVRHGEKIGGRYRCRAAEAFDQEVYRGRKLVERVFGNVSSRRVTPLTYRLPETREKAMRLMAAGHNLKCLLTVEALTKLFKPL